MEKDKKRKILKKIASIRKDDANLSVIEIAGKFGISSRTYESYENRTIPNIEIIEKICNAPNRKVRPAWVLFDEEPRYVDMLNFEAKSEIEDCLAQCDPEVQHLMKKLAEIFMHDDETHKGIIKHNINSLCGDKLWVRMGRPERRKKYIPIKSVLERRAKIHDYGNGKIK